MPTSACPSASRLTRPIDFSQTSVDQLRCAVRPDVQGGVVVGDRVAQHPHVEARIAGTLADSAHRQIAALAVGGLRRRPTRRLRWRSAGELLP